MVLSLESEGEDDKNDEPEVAADKETSDNVEEVEMEIQSPESEVWFVLHIMCVVVVYVHV